MANSRRDKMPSARTILATAFSLSVVTAACTPATPDSTPLTGTGGNASGGSNGAGGSTGSGGSAGSGGSSGSGGATAGSASGASGGTTTADSGGSSGSSAGGSGGTGGSNSGSSGGTVATDGSVGSGSADGAAATGCNWIQNADGTWMFDPAAPNKIVLFDGTNLDQWHSLAGGPAQWKIIGDGSMQVVPQATPTNIQTNMKFDDLCVHVEYMTPMYPSSVTGQLRGNSGVYLKSAYEMQILDSYGQPPDINTCGAVYSISKPLVVACHMELVWNTYEIEFTSSGWDNSTPPKKIKDAVFVKCALNGQIVQLNVDLNPPNGFTQAGIPDAPGPQPLALQDHRDLVSFRNVWVRVPQY